MRMIVGSSRFLILLMLSFSMLLHFGCTLSTLGCYSGIAIPKQHIEREKSKTSASSNDPIAPVLGLYLEPRQFLGPLKLRLDGQFIFGHSLSRLTYSNEKVVGLNFDLLLKYKFSPFTSPYIIFGPRLGYYGGKDEVSSGGASIQNGKVIYRNLELGFLYGAGIAIDFKSFELSLEWQYYQGASRLEDEFGYKFKNRFHTILLGFQIHALMEE